MSIRDDILGQLGRAPATTNELVAALDLQPQQVSMTCSALKAEGRLSRDDETKRWSLAVGGASSGNAGSTELVTTERPRGKRTAKPEPTLHEKIAAKLQEQINWAQEALDDYLEAQGDPKTKVLVDNLIAAKAAQLAFEAEE